MWVNDAFGIEMHSILIFRALYMFFGEDGFQRESKLGTEWKTSSFMVHRLNVVLYGANCSALQSQMNLKDKS